MVIRGATGKGPAKASVGVRTNCRDAAGALALAASNGAIIHAGGEGTLQPNSAVRLTGNQFESARRNATALDTLRSVRVEASGNRVSGVRAVETR